MQVNNFHNQISNRINQAPIYYFNEKKTSSRPKSKNDLLLFLNTRKRVNRIIMPQFFLFLFEIPKHFI